MADNTPNQNELPITIDIEAAEAAAQAASDASIEALRKAALAEAAAKGKPAPQEPEDETVVVDEPEAPEQVAVSVDEGLEKLRAQLAESQAQRDAANRRANAAAQAEARALTEVQESQLAMVTNAIATVKQAQEVLKGRYRDARAAGDADAEFDVQAEMSANAARLVQLEQGRQRLESTPKPQPRTSDDPVVEFTSKLTPESAAWVRAHPEYVREPDKNRQMIAAHELAVTRGAKVDTPEYFAAIERTLEIGHRPKEADPMKEAAKPAPAAAAPKKAAPAAAPVSRSGTGAGERINGTVHLSSDEREIARLNKMTDAEYAKAKIALKREKRLN